MAYWNSYNSYKNGCLSDYTYSTPRSMADYDLMGWHYGVLRTNTAPGYLVETWFHDYRPESLRFKSSLYNKFLAWQIAVGQLTAPGGSGSLPGCIIGDVRDTSKSCGYTNYTTRNRDSKLALNDVTVTLSGNGQTQTVNTGSKCNGVYAFFVPAGTYTITVKKTGYKTQTKTVTVTNSAATQWNVDMVAGTDAGISVDAPNIGYGETPVGNTSGKTLKVTGSSLSSNITVTNSDNTNFSVTPTSLGTSGGTINITFKPQSKGSHSTTITLKSGSYTATCKVTGTAINPVPTFTEGWNYSETSGKKAAWMSDYTSYRNMAFGNGKLYVVDVAKGVVKIINAQTAAHIKDMNMTGVSGGALALVDVAYVDGKLVGTGIATKGDDTAKATLKVYVWDNDDAAPRCILNTTNLGGMDRVGDAIEIQGNLTTGKICYLGQQSREITLGTTTSTKNCNSIITYAISNGVVSTTPVVANIDNFIVGLSPRLIPDGSNFWAVGQNYKPTLLNASGEVQLNLNADALQSTQGNDFVKFTFKGDEYAFATEYDPGTSGDAQTMLKNGRAAFMATSGDMSDATRKAYYPSTGFSANTRNTSCSSSICVNVNGEKGVEMWVLVHNQGIAYYKYGTPATYDPNQTPTEPGTPVNPDPTPSTPADPGVSAPTLKKVWEYTSGLPTATSASVGSTEAAYGTGFNGTVYTVDKVNTTIWAWNSSQQKVNYASNAAFTGIAITCDDAGNLLVNSGIYSTSATTWNIVAASSKAVTPITVTFPSDIASGNTYHVGRVVGNMLSSEGAYVYLTRAGVNKVACVKIANGAFVSATSSDAIADLDAAKVQNISYAQPSLETVAQINAASKPANCFYLHDRAQKNYYSTTGVFMAAPSGSYTTDGGDVVTLSGKTYAMFPMGTAYGSAFSIVEKSANEIVAQESNTVANVAYYQSLVFEKVSETKANIYQYYAGGKVAMYTFEVPGDATAIESVDAEVSAPVEYYNLQGVKVANPSNGLFIKKQGNKTTKVIL